MRTYKVFHTHAAFGGNPAVVAPTDKQYQPLALFQVLQYLLEKQVG